MTDKELVHRALMGDEQAQQECTEKGIVLPCPFCGNEYLAITNVQGYGIEIKCQHCNITFSRDFYGYGRAKERCRSVTLRAWNTRPVQPVGKCRDCRFCEGMSKNQALHCSLNSFGIEYGLTFITPESFCSYFEPKEESPCPPKSK